MTASLDSDLLREMGARVLRLDGAMGTEIQRRGLSEGDFRQGLPVAPLRDVAGDNECLNLTRPDVIRDIHRSYVDAGVDIIETNSFGANALVQGDYGLEGLAPDMAFAAARLAREVADSAPRKVWVAGSMGPTSKSLSLVADYMHPEWRPCSFDEMASAYEAQARALIDGGVDLIMVETCFDALNAKAALYAIGRVRRDFPVVVSVSVSSAAGRTLSGQSLEAFFAAVSHAPLVAFGLNCSMGADGLMPLVRDLASWCPVPLICYPNAGLPNARGCYDHSPEHMADCMTGLDGLVNIVGGCCGTTPEHIKAFPVLRPRPFLGHREYLKVSGLEAYGLDGDVVVSDASDARVSAQFAALIGAGEYDEALMMVSESLAEDAQVLRIDLDTLPDSAGRMERFVRMVQGDPSVSRCALMICSSDWETLIAGLKNAQGRCLVSGFRPDGEQEEVIRSLGAEMATFVS